MKIVDAHFHLWNLDENYYPWLAEGNRPSVAGDYSALRHNYVISDFLADVDGLDVIGAVHIQAEHDPADHVRETRWLQGVADDPASRGMPQAIVVNEDLARPDLDQALEAHCRFRNVRGVRQALHRRLHESPPYDPLRDPAFRRNFPRLARYGLSFDLQFFPHQCDDVVELVRENPGVQFIITHAGMPLWGDDERLALWRRALTRLARYPNTAAKISGFGMWDPQWTARSIEPVVSLVAERFSPARCMLASNFPVERMHKAYGEVWRLYDRALAHWTAEERAAVFRDNALRYYRIDPEGAGACAST